MSLETVVIKEGTKSFQLTYQRTKYPFFDLIEIIHGSKTYQCICKEQNNPLFKELCEHHYCNNGCNDCSGYEKSKGCYNSQE